MPSAASTPSQEEAESTYQLSDEALRVAFVDQSKDAQDEARDRADARLDRELGEGGRAKRFFKGIWKGNIAKDFYRQRYISQELNTMQEENTVHAGSPQERRGAAMQATINRFTSEYEELIHTNAGEHKETQGEDTELTTGIKDLVRQFAEGTLSESALQEERTRLLIEYRREHGPDALGKGIVTADNLLAVAKTVAGAVEHGESLDHTIARMQIITGEARNGARTEAHYNLVDKVIDQVSRSKVGSLISPTALTAGVTIAATLARMGSHRVVTAAAATLAPGLAAGLFAGLKENKRVKDERAQHAREIATGGRFADTDKRRVEMEKTRYDSVSAVDMISHINGLTDEAHLEAGGNDALQAALDALAAVRARTVMSDEKGMDLISFTSKEDVGEERMMLDLAMREARLSVDARLDAEARAALNLGPNASIEGLIDQRSFIVMRSLIEGEGGIIDRDKAFSKLKNRRVAAAAATGVLTGLVGGMVAQETLAAFDSTRFGLIDMIRGETPTPLGSDGQVHQTLLEGMIRGDETAVHTAASTSYDAYTVGSHGTSMEVSADHSLVTNPDGSMNLVDGNGKASVEGLTLDGDGKLTQDSLDKLHDAGMVLEDKSSNTDVTTTTNAEVPVNEYLQNHAAETTAVERDLWYDNDTATYDQNELRLYNGGNEGTPGIVDGGFQYTVAGMDTGGSYHDGQSANWHDVAASGNLYAAISATVDGQAHPFMVPIGPDGTVNIPADSPAGHFFANEDGQAVFKGAYMEIVQTTGTDANGVEHMRMLATLEGDQSASTVPDVITTTTTEHHVEYAITTNGYDTIQSNFTEMAPVTPVASRRSMEALRSNEARPEGTGYGYEGRTSIEQLQRWESERSPRLRDNPDVDLQTAQELDFYFNQQEQKRGSAYLAELNARIDNSEALKAINTDSRAIVVMPVGAAQESENIYNALSLYAQQSAEAKEKTTVLLNVNWIDDAMDDPDKKARIEKTISEIERAKADFPDLNIADFQKVWSREWVRDVRDNAMYGEVIKTLYDTAALAVRRGIQEGRVAPDQDVLLITNDADQLGMNRRYLDNYIKAEEKDKDSDAFIGTIRWGVDAARDFPGYHVSQLFMQAMNIAATRKGSKIAPATIGPNAAFRVSAYAAVGGCEDTDRSGVGADSQLGRKILAARGRLPENIPAAYGTLGVNIAYTGASTEGTRQQVIRQVSGSDIDSDPGRLLNSAYRKEDYLPNSWSGFNAGTTRADDQGNPSLIEREDPSKNFGEIQGRVERQITDFLGDWYRNDKSVASFTLSMLFPDGDKGAADEQSWSLEESPNGGYRFRFTPAGARRFKNQLMRDAHGRFDPIASRLRRQVYGEVGVNAKRRPGLSQSRLVRTLS